MKRPAVRLLVPAILVGFCLSGAAFAKDRQDDLATFLQVTNSTQIQSADVLQVQNDTPTLAINPTPAPQSADENASSDLSKATVSSRMLHPILP